MHGQLNYQMSREHIADLQTAARRERLARSVRRSGRGGRAKLRLTQLSATGPAVIAPARDDAQRERPRGRDRLAARLRRHGLDRALAREPVPPARAGLALRARMLAEPTVRADLGRQLRRVVDDARRAHPSPGLRIRPSRSDVLSAAGELDALADRLLSPDPVAARGVAQVRLLVTDGTGPLYRLGAIEDLRAAATRALESLQPEPDPQR